MARAVAAQSVVAQLSFLGQILPIILSGVLAFAAAVYLAVRNSEAEHQRWLRQERHKAYATFHATATNGLVDLKMLHFRLTNKLEDVISAIEDRAQQTSFDLQRPLGSIKMLGPKEVIEAASRVDLELDLIQRDMKARIAGLDFTDPSYRHQATPGPDPDPDPSKLFPAAEAALIEFERRAVKQVRTRPDWRARRAV
jgi:hypothetical protein